MKIIIIKCPICNKKRCHQYKSYQWEEKNIKYNLIKCNFCKSIFTNPLPSSEFLKSFYQANFNYKWYKDYLPAKIKDSELRYKEYKKDLGGNVLDFGGGLGYFSSVCRKNGLNSITFDPYISPPLPNKKKWDTVVALHVIEHTNDIDNFFSSIKSVLKKNGNLILCLPNLDGIGYKELDMNFVWAQPPFLHIFHISTKGLIIALKRNGFVNIKISYHDRWDANLYADILKKNFFTKCDALWNKKYLGNFTLYRKLIAFINLNLRFCALRKSLKINLSQVSRSELEIRANFNGY